MPRTLRPVATALLGVVLVGAAACGQESEAPAASDSGESAAATAGAAAATLTATGTAEGEAQAGGGAIAPPLAGEAPPEVERAMAHLRHLSETIGPRPAGSDAERRAAAYIVEQLRSAGYDTEIEEFTFESDVDDSSVTLGDGALIRALAMRGAANLEVSGTAVHGGLGRAEDLAGADLRGKVVIFDRGIVTFGDKARAAEAGGAVAVVIVNSEPGLFRGALGGEPSTIPVVSVAGEEAEALEGAIGRRLTVTTRAGRESITSQNVIGRVGGTDGECRAYLGAHYDSVSISPGANDNASGTAVVIEVARVNPIEGLCVVLFGAEELGLFGSQDYVARHLAGTGRFMINVDMAGRLDGPVIVGDGELTQAILDAIGSSDVGATFRAGRFPPFASSDHVSFESVGVPAVTFNSGDDAAIHSTQDTMERIDERALAAFLAAVDVAIDALVDRHADALAR